jgi:hypothetical protein
MKRAASMNSSASGGSASSGGSRGSGTSSQHSESGGAKAGDKALDALDEAHHGWKAGVFGGEGT